jgi:peptidoglycan hydrolase CwlO-like protein
MNFSFGFCPCKSLFETLLLEVKKMSQAVDDYVAKQQAHNAAVSKDLDDLADDLKALNQKIADLIANTTGSAADIAALNTLATDGQALEDKANNLSATNAQAPTPPTAGTATAG